MHPGFHQGMADLKLGVYNFKGHPEACGYGLFSLPGIDVNVKAGAIARGGVSGIFLIAEKLRRCELVGRTKGWRTQAGPWRDAFLILDRISWCAWGGDFGCFGKHRAPFF